MPWIPKRSEGVGIEAEARADFLGGDASACEARLFRASRRAFAMSRWPMKLRWGLGIARWGIRNGYAERPWAPHSEEVVFWGG